MTYASEVTADAPIYRLTFDQAGSTITDTGSSPRTVTQSGSPSKATTPFTTGLSLNGSNQYLSLASVYDFGNDTNYSIEVWFKSTQTTGMGTFLRRDSLGADLFRLNAGKVEFYHNNASDAITTGTYADGKWHHAVAVRTGTSTIVLYVDGVQVATGSATSHTHTTSVPTYIGTDSGGAEFFNGTLDELAFYDTALSLTRIQAHYNAGIALINTKVTAPVTTLSMTAPAPSAIRIHKTVSAPAATLSLTAPVPASVKGYRTVTTTVYATEDRVLAPSADSDLQRSNAAITLVRTSANTNDRVALFKFPVPTTYAKIDSASVMVNVNSRTNGAEYAMGAITSAWTESGSETPTRGSVAWTGGLNLGDAFNGLSVLSIVNTAGYAGIYVEAITNGTTVALASSEASSNRPYMTIVGQVDNSPNPITVSAPAATISLTAPTPNVIAGTSKVVQPPCASLSLSAVPPVISSEGNARAIAPATSANLTFPGGSPKNPDYRAAAGVMEASVSSPNPSTQVRYPTIVSAPAMTITLNGTSGTVINLTTNKLSKTTAMSLTVRMVGIYVPAADRYLAHVPGTVDMNDIWYRLNETSGTVAHDSIYGPVSGTRNSFMQDGTLNGGVTLNATGPQLRKAVSFDGVDDWLLVGPYGINNAYNEPNGGINPATDITVEFGIRTTDQNGVVFYGAGASPFIASSQIAAGQPKAGAEVRLVNGEMVLKTKEGFTARIRKNIADGEWHHVIFSVVNSDNGRAKPGSSPEVFYSDDFNPIIAVYIDGQLTFSRYEFQVPLHDQIIPWTFMAKVDSAGNKVDHLAGDLSDVIVRVGKAVAQKAAQKLYYEWSESLLVNPEPMTISLSVKEPFKARGNALRMLALYGLPWRNDPITGDPTFTYFSNLSGMLIETMNYYNVKYNTAHVGRDLQGFNVYYTPKPFRMGEYVVYPVSIIGDDNRTRQAAATSLDRLPPIVNTGVRSAPGMLKDDLSTNWTGQLVDDATGLPRFINLQEDLAEPVTNFDLITTVNYPFSEPEAGPGAGTPHTQVMQGNGPENNEYQGAVPYQANLLLSDSEWSQARDRLRDSILDAAYEGVSLWIGEWYAAQHLGFVGQVDIHKAGFWSGSTRFGDGGGLNLAAQTRDRAHLVEGNSFEWAGRQGDYYSFPQVNAYCRIVSLEPDFTDLPTNEFAEIVQGYPYDVWRPNGYFTAFDIYQRPNGLQVGDKILMNLMEWKDGAVSAFDQSNRVSVISARPEGIVGKVIAREMESYYLPFGEVYDNPYKNNATTIVAERGTVVRGKAIKGRAFIEFMGTQHSAGLATDAPSRKDYWNGDFVPGGKTTWHSDSRRNKEVKLQTETLTKTRLDNATNIVTEYKSYQYYFSFESGPVVSHARATMVQRGLNWLASADNSLPAGAVKVFAQAMTVSLTTPAPGFSRTRNLNLPVVGSMRLDLSVRQPKNYRDGEVSERAFPMSMSLDFKGTGKLVKVTGTMLISLTSVNPPRAVGEGDKITVYLDGERTITLFLKEDN